MDLGFGGLGPLFPDGTFEYVPIPDNPRKTSSRTLLFSQIQCRSGGDIDRFVPAKYRGGPAHLDPEFETFTYGDPTRNKRQQLLRLASGDILVFYVGLRPQEQRFGSRLFVIGYFTVAHAYAVTATGVWPPATLQHLWQNAHFRRSACDPGLVVVQGLPDDSRLLRTAVPLSDDRQVILPEMERRLGITGSVKRAGAGRWIPSTHVSDVAEWLRSLEKVEPICRESPEERKTRRCDLEGSAVNASVVEVPVSSSFEITTEDRAVSTPLIFKCGPAAHNDWVKGAPDGWEWSTRGAGYEGERDFFSVHWQVDTPKGFFADWQIGTPKGPPHAARIDVRLHVASPQHEVDPELNDLKQDVIQALLESSAEHEARASGLGYEIGRLISLPHVRKHKTTEAFRVTLNPNQSKPTYKEDIQVVHAAVGLEVDRIVRRFFDQLATRFGH